MTEDMNECMSRLPGQRVYKPDMLKNAQMDFKFLEHQSLVDFVEMDNEYIISTGRDHDINVWDAIKGLHIRRLSGHTHPVTGLHMHSTSEPNIDRRVVTSSEDGTIRQWSLKTGEELRRFDTDAVITCMGVLNEALTVTGNHKGYMEVRHLLTGELYSTIMAHFDPIETIVVKDNFACTATYDPPSCLKVWEIHLEQITCVYRIEFGEAPTIQFASLDIWKTRVFLGDSTEPKIHCIDFKTGKTGIIDLDRSSGYVQNVTVVNGWILSCSAYKKDVVLDVHRVDNFEHFGTFHCKMQQVYAVAAVESGDSLKIAVGGSALAVLNFEFILEFNRFNRQTKKSKFTENVEVDNKIMCSEINKSPSEESSDSSDNSTEHETINNNPFTHILCTAQTFKSSGDGLYTMDHKATEYNAEKENGSKLIYDKKAESSHENKVFEPPKLRAVLNDDQMEIQFNNFSQFQPSQNKTVIHGEKKSPGVSVKMQCEKICQKYKDEPRVALKKLDKLFDDKPATESIKSTNESGDKCEPITGHNDTEALKEVDIYSNMFINTDEKMYKKIYEENDISAKQNRSNFRKTVQESEQSITTNGNEVEQAEGVNELSANGNEGNKSRRGKNKMKKGEKSIYDAKKCKTEKKCLNCQII